MLLYLIFDHMKIFPQGKSIEYLYPCYSLKTGESQNWYHQASSELLISRLSLRQKLLNYFIIITITVYHKGKYFAEQIRTWTLTLLLYLVFL